MRSIYRYIFQTSGDFAGEWKIATIISLLKKNGLAFLIVIWKDYWAMRFFLSYSVYFKNCKKKCALHQLMKHLESDKLLPDY